MIKKLALHMANGLGNTLDSKEDIEIYAYALQWILMLAFNLTLVILAAYLLNIIPTTLAFLAVFMPFRAFGGGVHLSTVTRCIIIGSLLMLGSAYLSANLYLQPYQLSILFLFTLLFSIICTIKWAPARTEKNPVNDMKIARMQKRILLIGIMIWTGCISSLIYFDHNDLALAMILGSIVTMVLISPFGFYLMGFIDRMLNNIGKEVSNL